MLDTILGIKQKMGAVYLKDRRYSVTWVKAEPCVVTQIKNTDKDGYMAVQLGTGSKKIKNFTKALKGHLKSINNKQETGNNEQGKLPRYLREIRIKEESTLKVGDTVKLTDVLKKGDVVTITGVSKGKGFAGVVKRYRFAGGPKTHGQSDRERAPGSIGQRTTPGRVYKGKRMAGRMGSDQVSVKNLTVIDIDVENNLLALTGPVPGITNGLVFVKKIGEGGVKVETEESFDKAQDKQAEEVQTETEKETEKPLDEAQGKQDDEKTESFESFDKAQDKQAGEVESEIDKEEVKDQKTE